MNALQIREILLKVQKEMKCPSCSSTIESRNIGIHIHSESSDICELKMECQKCLSVFGGIAQFTNKVTELGKKLNASSRMKGNMLIDEFSIQEAKKIKEKLLTMNDFSDIFPKKK